MGIMLINCWGTTYRKSHLGSRCSSVWECRKLPPVKLVAGQICVCRSPCPLLIPSSICNPQPPSTRSRSFVPFQLWYSETDKLQNTQFLMHCIMLNTVHCSFEICNHLQHLPMSIGWLVRPSIGNTLRRLNATLTQIWTIFGSERHISPIFQANKANFAIPFLQLARVKFFTFIMYLPRVLNCSPSLLSFSEQLKF